MDNFCVVEFNDGVQMVPENWIFGTKCYWPHFKSSSRFIKAVQCRENPDSTWSLYSVKILGTYDCYETAKKKLKLAEERTDLESSDAEDAKKKRKLNHKKNLSSGPDSDEDDFIISSFPKPPQKVLTLPNNRVLSKTETEVIEDLSDETPGTSEMEDSTSNLTSSNKGEINHESKVLKELFGIKLKLVKMEQIIENNKCKCKQVDDNIQLEEMEDFENIFPINNDDELKRIELLLENTDYKNKLGKILTQLGGIRVDERAKLILRKIITDKFAMEFNWLGLKNKKKFESLNLTKVIIREFFYI
ncbi:unnamed protein product [Brassicogethes aeneus]|uniref:DUF4806 domain-containing protein n=1 Tax=Brassicogethes aeneus TaxID=1431903 RepID=A0A9P0AVK2_BRAAE|nr:unnamed protein product [Brassicogethes aeneus]